MSSKTFPMKIMMMFKDAPIYVAGYAHSSLYSRLYHGIYMYHFRVRVWSTCLCLCNNSCLSTSFMPYPMVSSFCGPYKVS